MNNVQIIKYSEKAIVIAGDTKPIKAILKDAGGKFNARLTHPIAHTPLVGWIFAKSKENVIIGLLTANNVKVDRVTPDKVYDKVEEDLSPYIPIPAQFGRPFTIRHCVNCGQRLMVDPLDLLLNIDKDVLCDACKNPKKYEKKEEKTVRL